MGVLQRISLCYFTIVCIHLIANGKYYAQAAFISICLIIYAGFMYGYDVHIYGRGNIET